ncbi:MAG: hypothetical protein AAGB29_11790 [Planctomycetota bacterium]
MSSTFDDLGMQVGRQGLTWRQRARLAQLRAQRLAGPAAPPEPEVEESASAGRLRLVRDPETDAPGALPDREARRAAVRNAAATRRAVARMAEGKALVRGESLRPDDPRWVVALRAAHALDHATIVPEQRGKLVRLGRSLGLSPFDVNLIVAIVQDQARRGTLPEYCASAGAEQLAMIPLPKRVTWRDWLRPPRLVNTLIAIGSLLGLQVLLIWWLVGDG